MTDADYITDRALERLALGELDEDETQELLRTLEERGEMDRFEAIIADDEAFFEAHPPAQLAAQIRTEVRRRERAQPNEPKMRAPRQPIVLGFAAVVAAVVIIAVFQLTQRAAPPTPTRIASATTQTAEQTIAAPSRTPTPAQEPDAGKDAGDKEPTRPRVALLDHGNEFPLPSTLYVAEGEIIEAVAAGISRVAISITAILDASLHEERLYIEAKDEGQAVLTLARKGRDGSEDQRSALVVVGQPLKDDVLATLVAGENSLLSCQSLSDETVTLRIAAQYGMGFVGNAHVAGGPLEPELRSCIDGVVGRWKVGDHLPRVGDNPGPKQLSVGVLRLDLGKGAICGPDDDC